MTGSNGRAPRQISARPLGAGHWRVELEFPDGRRPALDPGAYAVEDAEGIARVVSTTRGPRGDRLTVIIALGATGDPRRSVRLRAGGWTTAVSLAGAVSYPKVPVIEASPSPSAELDLRGRDYEALRRRLLRVIATRTDLGSDAHPVAESTSVVELMAYLGDTLSYAQDAISTEAYLATARRRVSVRRHAELLDYRLGEGRSARVWVRFTADRPVRLARGTPLLTEPAAAGAAPRGPVFETTAAVDLEPERPALALDERHHPGGRLPPGATTAWLKPDDGEPPGPGALAVIEPSRVPGAPGHVVRIVRRDGGQVHWAPEDALPPGLAAYAALELRIGNLVVADHGSTGDWQALTVPAGRRWWPLLHGRDPALVVTGPARPASATAELWPDPVEPMPAVELRESSPYGLRSWRQRSSLLASAPFDRDFVVEIENDRSVRLRFGDDVNGSRPWPGTALEVRLRSGSGRAGAIAAHHLRHLSVACQGVTGVTNPTASVGADDPEPISSARIEAPQAFRHRRRAIDAAGLIALARAVPGVADVAAELVASGGRQLAQVRVAGPEAGADDPSLIAAVRAAVGPRLPMGVVLEVAAARVLPVSVELQVLADRRWGIAALQAEIDAVLASTLLDRTRWRFGVGLHRSEPVTALAGLSGISDVRLTRFGWTRSAAAAPPPQQLLPPFGMVIGIANDPLHPDRGLVDYRIATVVE